MEFHPALAERKYSQLDEVSRLPLPEVPDPPEMVLLMEHLASTPVSAQQIKRLTDRVPVLSEVKRFVLQGWPLCSDTMAERFITFHQTEIGIECARWVLVVGQSGGGPLISSTESDGRVA